MAQRKKSESSTASTTSTNPTPFIDASNARTAFDESNRWLWPYFEPIDELERIARNRPSTKIPSHLPKITDGTMASLLQEQPKRIIQQLSTGLITCVEYPEYAIIADVVHRNHLLPNYQRMGTALQKHWNMMSKSLTWGRSTSYTFFTNTSGIFHTDFVLPYVKDVITEKGKVYAPDSNVQFMRSWYQKRDIKAIIDRETWLEKNKPGYKSDWDLTLLSQLYNTSTSAKPANLQTAAEREKGMDAGGYEIIHAFQKGVKAQFYSFSPRFEDGRTLRTKVNKDPRGMIPLDHEYCNIDLSNPLGRGSVELSGGIQNLMDQKMQMHQFMSTLLMAPPLQVWGSPDINKIKFKPNAIWEMGASQNNKVEPYQVDNHAIANFTNEMQFLQSKIYNLNSANDTSIPSANNNVGQSKTPQGVQAQEQRLGVSDNYLEKQHEAWFGAQSETSINVFFAEMNGKSQIDLGKVDLQQLEGTVAEKYVDEKSEKLNVNYGDISNATFMFKTDPGSSKTVDDAQQMQILQEIITEVGTDGPVLSWYLGQQGVRLNVGELYRQRFERMGLRNLDVILQEMSPEEKQQAQQSPFPIIDKPQIRLTGQIPPSDLAAALAAGGVQTQQNISNQSPVDYADILKDPTTPLSIKQQIWQMGGLQPAPGDPTFAPQTQPAGPTEAELALRQRELDIKQQASDQNNAKIALDIAKQSHQQTIETHKAASDHALAIAGHEQQVQQNAIQNTMQAQSQQAQQQQAQQQLAQQSQAQQGQNSSNPAPQESPQQEASETPQQDAAEPPQEQLQEVQQDLGNQALNQQEVQLATKMFQQGFSESDVEQAVVMLRQGRPLNQVIQIIGAKYAQQ